MISFLSYSRLRATLLAFLLYMLLAIVMTWPVIVRLDTHLFGRGVDAWSHYWTFWWIKEALRQGLDPYYTTLLYYPDGVSLTTQNIAWVNIALWLPLQAVLDGVAAYNLASIAIYALNGFTLFLLISEIAAALPHLHEPEAAGQIWLIAFIGGLVGAFWPYIQRHSFHPNLSLIAAIPLALLFLRRILRGGRQRDVLLAGVFVALIGITRWQLLIMAAFPLSAYLLYTLATHKAVRTATVMGRLVQVGLLAGGLMLPLVTPVIWDQLTNSYPEDVFYDEEGNVQADLFAYIVPGHTHPLWGDLVEPLYEPMPENHNYYPFLGYTVLLLAAWGVYKNWPRSRVWLFVALVCFILALGPDLLIHGRTYSQVPMPYRLIDDFSFVRVLRKPHRFNVILSIPVAILVSFGVTMLLRQWPPRQHFLLAGFIGLLILFEYSQHPFAHEQVQIPAWHTRQLAQESGDFGVLDLPIEPRGVDKDFMFFQTVHHKPIVSGHVSRIPREALNFINSVPLLQSLSTNNEIDPALADISHQLRLLADANIRYLVIHKRWVGLEKQAAWRRWLTVSPLYEDDELIVYRTAPELGRDFELAHHLTPEIGLVDVVFNPPDWPQAGTMQVMARWGSATAPGAAYEACLNLEDATGVTVQTECDEVAASRPTAVWQPNEIVLSQYTMKADPFLPAGIYSVTLSLNEARSGAIVGRPVTLGQAHIDPIARTFTVPEFQRPVLVEWGDDVRLLGYGLDKSENKLDLTVYWQAQRRMDTDYTVFVHLLDEQGNVVAQDDAVPRRWSYPTTWWEAGEVVADTIPLDLAAVPSGTYTLTVGLYNAETGVRAPACSATAGAYPGYAVPLTTMLLEK